MGKCKLCNLNVANKTNTHVVPHFLIESMINVEGKKGRGRELSIAIGKGVANEYFGESVLPEKIEEFLGKTTLTDEEVEKIKEEQHHFSVDYFFCSDCENRFSEIENIYSKVKPVTQEDNTTLVSIPTSLSFLFWSSIIWRLSVTGISEFKIDSKEEKKLRNILNLILTTNKNQLIINCELHKTLIDKYAYILLKVNGDPKTLPGMCFGNPNLSMPYSFILNNYILLFYKNKKHRNQIKQSFYGLEKLYEHAPLNDIFNNQELIQNISVNDYKDCIDNFTKTQVDSFLKVLKNNLKDIHQKAFGFKCDESLINQTIHKIVSDNPEIVGGRYSKENIISTFIDTIKEQYLKEKRDFKLQNY